MCVCVCVYLVVSSQRLIVENITHTGRGVNEDHTAAFKLFLMAAEQGDAVGQFKVGGCYDEGRGVETDPSVAFQWYVFPVNKTVYCIYLLTCIR